METQPPPVAPTRASLVTRPSSLAVLGAIVAVAGSLIARHAFDLRGLNVDDAYIHLHIARNWAEGAGPVFNLGERVEASTSPAWLALLTLLLRAGLPGTAAVSVLEVAATALAGAGVAVLALELGGASVGLLAPLVLAALPAFSIWAASGLETPLAAGLLAWCLWLSLRVGRARSGALELGLLLVLLASTRPEMVTLAPVLIAVAVWRLPRQHRLQSALLAGSAFALPAGALLLLRHSYYGQWVPNTYVAKVAGIDLAHRLLGVRYIAKFVIMHAPLFAACALLRADQRARMLPALLCVAALLVAIMWTGGDHFYFGRLAVPALALLCLPLAVVAVNGVDWRRTAAVALLVAQPPFALFATADRGSMYQEQYSTRFMEEIGRAMTALPSGSLATIGIGAIAWFSRRPILDMVGLADAHIARSPRFPGAKNGHEHGDANYVMERAPDFVLLFTWPTSAPIDDAEELRQLSTLTGCCSAAIQLIEHPLFRTRYEPFDLLVESGQHQRMWRRRDRPR